MTGRDDLKRFTYPERLIHWLAGLSFVFLLFTGLAFSHPRLFWITSLVGGGSTARVLHPWMGVLFTVSMAVMFVMWAKEMGIQDRDRAWLKAIKHYAVHDKDNVPPAGKYNAGQKLFFWSMALLGIAYIVSGIPMWLPGGVLGVGPFYGGVVNSMRLVHYLSTVGGGLLLIVHVYLGTVACPGLESRGLSSHGHRVGGKSLECPSRPGGPSSRPDPARGGDPHVLRGAHRGTGELGGPRARKRLVRAHPIS